MNEWMNEWMNMVACKSKSRVSSLVCHLINFIKVDYLARRSKLTRSLRWWVQIFSPSALQIVKLINHLIYYKHFKYSQTKETICTAKINYSRILFVHLHSISYHYSLYFVFPPIFSTLDPYILHTTTSHFIFIPIAVAVLLLSSVNCFRAFNDVNVTGAVYKQIGILSQFTI